MDFAVTEEVSLIRQTVRRFVKEELLPLERPCQFKVENLPPETFEALVKKVKDIGLYGLGVPVQFGGPGLGQLALTLIEEDIRWAMVGTNVFGSNGPAALYTASDDLKERYLYPTLRGEKRSCFAFTEPITGADPSSMITNAVRDGDNYVINGRKIFITGAHKASYMQLFARMKGTTGREGITSFIVDMDAPGVHIDRIIYTMAHPSAASEFPCEIALTDVVVPASQRVGEEGGAWGIAQGFLGGARFGMGANAIARSERCLQMATDYAKQRVTFGQPIANRQAVQFMLADSSIEIESLRWLTYSSSWKTEQGMDTRSEISMVKVLASETLWRVADRAIQVHGGVGLTTDLPLELIFREARVDRIVDGPNEVHRFVIARNLLRK
jgi:acyl-CoA dehydrogenase